MINYILLAISISFFISSHSMHNRGLILPSQQPHFFSMLQQAVDNLIVSNADLNQKHDLAGYIDMPLPRVCRYNNLICKTLADRLLQARADPNQGNPLHRAAFSNSVAIGELLLDKKANINALGILGQTALHVAIQSDSFEFVELLLKRGADASITDRDQKETALLCIMQKMEQANLQREKEQYKKWKRLALMIENSHSLCIPNNQGQTALNFMNQAELFGLEKRINAMKTTD